MLAASTGMRNVKVWRPSVSLFVCPIFFLTVIGRAAHSQRDSPGGSTQLGQRTFPSEYYYEKGHFFCLFTIFFIIFNVNRI